MAKGTEASTSGNVRALWGRLWSGGVLKALRKAMGLGDTLGPLPPECGGTGETSLDALLPRVVRFSTGTAYADYTVERPSIVRCLIDGKSVPQLTAAVQGDVFCAGSKSTSDGYKELSVVMPSGGVVRVGGTSAPGATNYVRFNQTSTATVADDYTLLVHPMAGKTVVRA